MLIAIRRASSLVMRLAAVRGPGMGARLAFLYDFSC
jgi:hypothetical protein